MHGTTSARSDGRPRSEDLRLLSRVSAVHFSNGLCLLCASGARVRSRIPVRGQSSSVQLHYFSIRILEACVICWGVLQTVHFLLPRRSWCRGLLRLRGILLLSRRSSGRCVLSSVLRNCLPKLTDDSSRH